MFFHIGVIKLYMVETLDHTFFKRNHKQKDKLTLFVTNNDDKKFCQKNLNVR